MRGKKRATTTEAYKDENIISIDALKVKIEWDLTNARCLRVLCVCM